MLLEVRPHAWILARPLLLAVAVLAGAAAGVVLDVPLVAAWGLVGLVVLALVHLLGRWLRWRSTSLVVTSERVMQRSGLFARVDREIPIAQIVDVTCRRGLFERLIGSGDLLVQSAGRDSSEVFAGLPRPEEVEDVLVGLLSSRAGQAGTASGLSLPEQLERLDELRRRGVLSEEEFSATKARLLQGR